MKNNLLKVLLPAFVLIAGNATAQYAASNFTLIAQTDPETLLKSDSMMYSGCWGWYQADKQKEYAIACSHAGTYWIDITVPTSPTVSAYRAGKLSGCTWREAKSYKNFLYVISDDWGQNSFQIFDMQYLPDSVHKVYDGTDIFSQGHTLWVDGDRLYVASVTTANTYSSMCVYSLANPKSPLLLRALDDDYSFINGVHDMYVRHDTVYASCGYQGLYVFHFNGTAFSMLGSLTTYSSSGYNHSSALTPDGYTLVFADEVPAGLPIKVSDPTNLSNIQVLATVAQFPQTTPHNPFVPNNELCFVSSYEDGLQLFDIANPSVPQLAGYFDTYPQGGGNVNNWTNTYAGQWGCYPFFPSGNIFALDRQNGGFILRSHLYGGPYINLSAEVPTTGCVGSTTVLTAKATGATSLTWSAPGVSLSSVTGPSITVTFTAPGVYTINVTAAHTGSTTSAVRILTVSQVQAATTLTNPSCTACLNGAIKVTASSGIPPFSYHWTPAGGTSSLAINLAKGCYTVTVTDAAACTATAQACLTGPTTALQELTGTVIHIFPNPAHDRLFLEIPDNVYQCTVFNLLGDKILDAPAIFGTHELDVSALPKGLYILSLSSGEGRLSTKFFVE